MIRDPCDHEGMDQKNAKKKNALLTLHTPSTNMEVPPGRHVLGGIARALRFEPGLEAPRVVRAVQVAVRLLDKHSSRGAERVCIYPSVGVMRDFGLEWFWLVSGF